VRERGEGACGRGRGDGPAFQCRRSFSATKGLTVVTGPRAQAEDLLARKRAQLEEATRLRTALAEHHHAAGAAGSSHASGDVGSEPAAAGGGAGAANGDTAEQDRLKRAEVFRQVGQGPLVGGL
jgi:hypothetical protein